jgi:preprotein translocase subunit Sss1
LVALWVLGKREGLGREKCINSLIKKYKKELSLIKDPDRKEFW